MVGKVLAHGVGKTALEALKPVGQFAELCGEALVGEILGFGQGVHALGEP